MVNGSSAVLPSVFAVVDGQVPDEALSLDELGSRIVAVSGRLAAATCRWLLLVAEFDERRGFDRLGIASTALWLQYSCGIAHRTAVEHVRIARSLRAWPRLAEEMSAGRLSYSHVRVISRIATGTPGEDPATPRLVESLIDTARYGTVAQLEVMVRGLRSVHDSETLPADRPGREMLSQSWTAESQWRLSARLDAERGAQVRAAIEAVARAEQLSAPDALVRLAEIGLAALADNESGPRALRGEEQAAIVVHVTAEAVPQPEAEAEPESRSRERGAQPARPFGRVENGPGLPTAVIERLACAGRVRLAARGNGPHSDVLDLGRTHRLVTPRQYQALRLRDGDTCRYPGCIRCQGLQAHHVRHWLYGGRTDLDNLILLCQAHHLAHHDDEFTIASLGHGEFRFIRDGYELPSSVDPSALIAEPSPVENEHSHVAPDAAHPLWDGSRLDREYAVNVNVTHLNLPASA